LDKTFNTRAKDQTPLKKVCKERLLIHVPISDKRYEFKDVWEENIEIPEIDWNWDAPRVTEGLTVTSGSTITIADMDYTDSDTIVINSPRYWPYKDTTYGATR
jgi:hypothetical protein